MRISDRSSDVCSSDLADQADALARSDGVARLYPGDDAARHEARDLREADAQTIGAFDENMPTLIILARLVQVGVVELAWHINDAVDGAGDGGTIYVAVDHAHEDRYARIEAVHEGTIP